MELGENILQCEVEQSQDYYNRSFEYKNKLPCDVMIWLRYKKGLKQS